MVLKGFHHSQAIHLILLVEGDKFELFRVSGNIFEWAFDLIVVVSTDGGIFPGPAESSMKLFLSVNKRFVGLFSEFDIPQNGSNDEWPNLFD